MTTKMRLCPIKSIGLLTISSTMCVRSSAGAENLTAIAPATQPHMKCWSTKIPVAQCSMVLAYFSNEAVLYRETSLLWEQAPDVTAHECEGSLRPYVNKPFEDAHC